MPTTRPTAVTDAGSTREAVGEAGRRPTEGKPHDRACDLLPDLAYAIDVVIGEGDKVAVLYSWSGTNEGSLAGLPPTGRRVSATGAIICRVAEGRIVEQWDIDDRLDVIGQLGLFPAAGAPAA